MNIKQTLLDTGLNNNEAVTYLAVLELGNASYAQIEKKTKFKRPTLYYKIIPELIGLGLVLESTVGKRSSFVANDLKVYFEKKKQQFTEFENLVPEISTFINNKNIKPRVYFYEGIEGVKKVWLSHLQEGKEIYEFVGIENMNSELEKYVSQYYIQERVRRKISVKMIVSGINKNAIFHVKSNILELREVKVISQSLLNLPICIDIYGDNLSITLIRKDSSPIGMIISSKEISTTILSLFNFVWNNSSCQKV